MTERQAIEFTDNTGANNAQYISISISVPKVLESWRQSVFSFEWLKDDGSIKTVEELSEDERPKREAIEDSIRKGRSLSKPILGIGIQDNVEIGSGRAELLTLAAHGVEIIPVHIPKSNESDFQAFLADVNS